MICTSTYIYSIIYLDKSKDFFYLRICSCSSRDVSREAKKPSQITSFLTFLFLQSISQEVFCQDIWSVSSFSARFFFLCEITFKTQKFKKQNFVSFLKVFILGLKKYDLLVSANPIVLVKDLIHLFNVQCSVGVKVRNMKMDFNTGGTWRQVGQ